MNDKTKMLLIKIPYWLGIGADALWAIALLFPSAFAILTGRSDFNPNIDTRMIMGIGGSLMLGWTFLLFWAVRDPIERRVVIFLTAFPVVFGMFLITFIQFYLGNTFIIWAMVKTIVLITSMLYSFFLANKLANNKSK